MPDCETCEPSEPWSQPNKGFVVVINKLTGKKVHVCGSCAEAGVPREWFIGDPERGPRSPVGALITAVAAK